MNTRGRNSFAAYQQLYQRQAALGLRRTVASINNKTKVRVIAFLVITVIYTTFLYCSGGAKNYLGESNQNGSQMMGSVGKMSRKLKISTWNVAAINNNPFEYWMTIADNPGYEKLMINVEQFLENPGDRDIPVSDIFTDNMFASLEEKMSAVGWDPEKLVRKYWENDFKNRKIVSGFLKDPLLGSKRLASMPDRVTNTINVVGSSEPVCRPTVINMYSGDLSNMDSWWQAWSDFMFVTPLPIQGKDGGVESKLPLHMLKPISKAKYPDITEEEESISLPLQTMCGAIFDAILVHMMNTVSEPKVWQPLKQTIVEALNKKKVDNTLDILRKQYKDEDIVMLQEVSMAFIDIASRSDLSQNFHIVAPALMDATRDQNSIIMLNRKTFPSGPEDEITKLVEDSFPAGEEKPTALGDVLAIKATDMDGVPYVLASFHGDTNGLATIPVVTAMNKALSSSPELLNRNLIFGMDANTYEGGIPNKKQDVLAFADFFVSLGYTSCFGNKPNPKNYTTFNARTYLQPQLNKACKSTEKKECGDINPKDFILFQRGKFEVLKTSKDNTGKGKYIENMAFPTLAFPSDHGILSTVLKPM